MSQIWVKTFITFFPGHPVFVPGLLQQLPLLGQSEPKMTNEQFEIFFQTQPNEFKYFY